MTRKNTMSKATRAFTTRIFAGFVSAMMTLAAVPFFTVTAAAEEAPVLNMRNTVVTSEDLATNRNVGIDLVVNGNEGGFLAASFGIRYDDRLEYTDFVPNSETGDAFEVICNEEENLLWFVGAGGTQADTASVWAEDEFLSIYFDIPEEIEGGIFELNFVWTGLDGSQAYWYADRETDLMDEMAETSLNGKITYSNPDSEVLNASVLELNPYTQEKLEVLNASGEVFWFSSNPAVATVDENGVVNAVAVGTCQVQAFLNNKIMTCDVTVTDRYCYSVADSSELKLTDANANVVLEFPEDPEGTVTWISANPEVVTVDSDGTVRALKDGKANILATYNGTTYMRVINVELGVVAKRSAVLPGDVNLDDTVDIRDVVLCNRIYVGVESATAEQIQAGDVDGSGKIDLSDSM
ncbi:MAG: Ig-like domain-containing protein, partial [Oscillospiraceae bacterium]|nr:Ig-like domain-containing protein [Oscillospiraceae bacterium]